MVETPPPVALDVSGLEVVRRGHRVVRDVSFQAEAGQVVALLGPNGAGKSSILKAIVGLLPSAGVVRVAGTDLASLDGRHRARAVGYVPQRSMLRSALRVTEVVAHGRYALGRMQGFGARRGADDTDAVREALVAAGAYDLRRRVFTRLSAGEQQRVLLARALAADTGVLLLDEPTAALDVGQALQTFTRLRALADAGKAVVAVLHGLGDARRFADRVVLLQDGVVVQCGGPTDVVAPEPVRAVYGVTLVEGRRPGFELPEGQQ